MKEIKIENYGMEELNNAEMTEVNGGGIIIDTIGLIVDIGLYTIKGFAELFKDFIGAF